MSDQSGLRSRGYLPHLDAGRQTQFVTFRLDDSLPQEILDTWNLEVEHMPQSERTAILRDKINSFLDEGHGSCVLRNPIAANIVIDAFFFANANTADVHSFVVMPNHVHALVGAKDRHLVGEAMGRLKGYTALQINRRLGLGPGRLWQPESFDTLIRDKDHFDRTEGYIEWNPVKAGICGDPKKYPYSTACPVLLERLQSAR